MEELQIEIGTGARPDVRILRLTGPFTLSTMFDFQNIVREGAAAVTIVDLGGVPYMDSAGLGSVISLFASCQRTNRGFAITGLSDRIRTLFEMTHVDGLLPCFPTLEAADSAVAGH